MPRYDYKCECGEIFEVSHMMCEEPVVECPKCKSKKTTKLISVPIIRVHGSDVVERMLADKKGVERDRNLYTLEHNDPYGHMRSPGEKEELKKKLSKAGTINHDDHGNYTGAKYSMNKTKSKKVKK